ncbi:conserved hypothetical Ustilaginaceae-specific protein [Sporisorium reilianum SRZ2]|uniref:Conserved hypothetical Ustilaginaceae-specific protein n=1 Tax=Sporisorium reilianum (strain SRZ2) TaxID=999809 RepID=E6ZTU1_SPORE|nr:conserved hypothetical Ustilaginaceae-specific protein [Sporisorium reilianum SRZ2]
MRFLLLATAHVGFAAIVGLASPAGPPVQRAIDIISEHASDAVSTTLTLGRGSEHYFLPSSNPVPEHVGEGRTAFGFPSVVSDRVFSRSHTSPSGPPADPSITASTHHPDTAGPSHVAQLAQTPISPSFDLDFPNMLRDPRRNNWISLPVEVTYVHSPWLGDVYENMIFALQNRRLSVESRQRELSAELLAKLFDDGRLFYSQGQVYKLQLRPEWFPAARLDQPIEVLARYHSRFRWGDNSIKTSVTFWSTAEGGSKLALLGAFPISRASWESLTRVYPDIQRFSVVQDWLKHPGYGSFLLPRLFLKPKPLKGS